MHYLALHCNCTTSYVSGHWMSGQSVTIYGHNSDIEICIYLYTICERQIESAAKLHMSEYIPSWGDHSPRVEGAAFRKSAVRGLWDKLTKIKHNSRQENPTGFALVVNRKSQVDAWVSDNFRFGKARATKATAFSQAGYQAGKSLNISAGIGSSNTRKAIKGD